MRLLNSVLECGVRACKRVTVSGSLPGPKGRFDVEEGVGTGPEQTRVRERFMGELSVSVFGG